MVVTNIQNVNSLHGQPVGRSCPKCGQFLVEKKIRGGGKQVVCSNEECDYEEAKVK